MSSCQKADKTLTDLAALLKNSLCRVNLAKAMPQNNISGKNVGRIE